MSAPPESSLGAVSTVLALGETQLPAPSVPQVSDVAPRLADPRGGRYTPLEVLGRGGMGIVHGVWDGDLMRELAVKRIRAELRADPPLVAQFVWEARITAYLDHPNIVPVHDLSVTPEGEIYFTMKRALGTPLDRALDRLRADDGEMIGRLPLVRRLRVLHQVCMALAFAHGRGILHRDLKPANIVLGDHGEVLVMDWGLAIPLPGPAGDRIRRVMPAGIDQLMAGTPLYMSPEQARGQPLDERSDVFTLGVMLYELTSLARPFHGDSLREITDRVAAGLATPLREVWPDAPAPLVAVVERAIQRDPDRRYTTVDAFADDLERVIDGQTPIAEHASTITRLARYYVGRDRAMSALRVVDVDMWIVSGMFAGLAIGVGVARLLGHWRWAVILSAAILAVIVNVPPTWRWLTLRRRERHERRKLD